MWFRRRQRASGVLVQGATYGAEAAAKPYGMKLGMVTYNMGKEMKLDELIAFCEAVGLAGVELRTTHAHGVEVELTQGAAGRGACEVFGVIGGDCGIGIQRSSFIEDSGGGGEECGRREGLCAACGGCRCAGD